MRRYTAVLFISLGVLLLPSARVARADDPVRMGTITVNGPEYGEMIAAGGGGGSCTHSCLSDTSDPEQTWAIQVAQTISTKCHWNSSVRNTTSKSPEQAIQDAINLLNGELDTDSRVHGDMQATYLVQVNWADYDGTGQGYTQFRPSYIGTPTVVVTIPSVSTPQPCEA